MPEKFKRSIVGAGAAALASVALVIVGAIPANAAEGSAPTPAVQVTAHAGEANTVAVGDGTMGVGLGTPEVVTRAEVMADTGLTSSQKAEILAQPRSVSAAAAASTVKKNTWNQWVTGGSYTNTQGGTFYYNGSRVWVTQSYLGYQGRQSCYSNYVLPGWQIKNIKKSDTGSTTVRDLYCEWNVVQAPIPITTQFSMTAHLTKTGTISGFAATVG